MTSEVALFRRAVAAGLFGALWWTGLGLERPGTEFPIYQFPADALPRIDGSFDDWEMVPEAYVIGTEELWEDSGKHEEADPENLDVRVKVGWAKGSNQLYFYYEAYDDYWDFALLGLKNDTFEVVVDADLSGGPLIDRFRENSEVVSEGEAWWAMHGAHAQNYHIFTPAREKSWTMLWGPAQWLKAFPHANAAYDYDFEPGEGGRLRLEFWISLYDFARPEGPAHSVPSRLEENGLVGISWAIIDYDDQESSKNNGFWNLSRSHTMYGKASELVAFRLMPMESELLPALRAGWDFETIDREERRVAFFDRSIGEKIDSWYWEFGDGMTSTEANPVHRYEEPGYYVVTLTVSQDGQRSRYSRVWDVTFK